MITEAAWCSFALMVTNGVGAGISISLAVKTEKGVFSDKHYFDYTIFSKASSIIALYAAKKCSSFETKHFLGVCTVGSCLLCLLAGVVDRRHFAMVYSKIGISGFTNYSYSAVLKIIRIIIGRIVVLLWFKGYRGGLGGSLL